MDQTRQTSSHTGASVLGRGVLVTVALGALAAGIGLLVSGPPAAWGVLVGTVAVLSVCATGSFLVDAVAGLLPTASLMFALLTYTLQVLVVLMVFVGLERSGLLGSTLDRGWLGGAAIGAILVWLVSQILFTVRSRIPVYDLRPTQASATPLPSGSGATEAGDR